MREEIICAGFGGQGIMFMGKILAWAALVEGKKVTWMPSYGAEARGGTAYCMVIISDEEIPSPVVTNPDACIVMNAPSLEKFRHKVKAGGLFLINSSLIKDRAISKKIDLLELPCTEIAFSALRNIKVANMVALGAYISKRKVVSLSSAINVLKEIIPSRKQELLSLNKNALREGFKLVDGL